MLSSSSNLPNDLKKIIMNIKNVIQLIFKILSDEMIIVSNYTHDEIYMVWNKYAFHSFQEKFSKNNKSGS